MHIWQIPDDNNEKFDYLKAVGNNFEKVDEGFGEAVAKFTEPLSYKGEVTNISDLPSEATNGDIYNVTSENKNYIWNGTAWVEYSSTLDLSYLEDATKGYQTTTIARELEITDSAGVKGKLSIEEGNTQQEVIEGESGTTLTGTRIVTANDVDITKEHLITPIGNTEQESYEGKNLFDVDNPFYINSNNEIENNSIILTTGAYEPVRYLMKLKVGQTYRIQLKNNNTQEYFFQLKISDSQGTDGTEITRWFITSNIFSQTFEATSEYIMVVFARRIASTDTTTISNIQLEEGSTATDYEPYVGGTPSPNPDYPQKVNNVGSNINLFDEIFQQGGLDFGSTGSETSSSNRIRTDYIEVQPNTTYTISSGNSNLDSFGLGLYKSDNSYDSSHKINAGGWNNFPYTFTTQSDTKYIRVAFRKSDNTDITPSGDYKIKLEEGSQPTGYTPYNRGGIDLKVENKNLFDKDTTTDGKYVASDGSYGNDTNACCSDYIKIIPNQDYYISGRTNYANLAMYDKNKVFIDRMTMSSANGILKVTNTNCTYIRINMYLNNKDNFQIEQGSTSTSYIAHAEQNITIPLPEGMELCRSKDGQYSDNLFHNIPSNPMYNASLIEGGWYKYNAIYEEDLDGSEDETYLYISSGSVNGYSQFNCTKNIPTPNNDNGQGDLVLANYFSYYDKTATVQKTQAGIRLRNTNPYIVFSIDDTLASSEATFRTWLSTHITKIKYVLATPTYTQITDTDTLEALNTMESFTLYNGITNVIMESEIDGNIELKYNYVTPAPSPARPSDINNVGSNVNIINLDNLTRSSSNVTYNSQTSNSVSASGSTAYNSFAYFMDNPNKNTNYTFSFKMKETGISSKKRIQIIGNSSKTVTGSTTIQNISLGTLELNQETNAEVSFNTGNFDYIGLVFWNNDSGTALSTPTIWNITEMKLEQGNKTGYTPYNRGGIDVKVENKNLFDKNIINWTRNNNANYKDNIDNNTTRIRTLNPIQLEGGKTYTISGFPNEVTLGAVKFYENLNSTQQKSLVTTSTFTVPIDATYTIFQFNGENFTDATKTLMKNANIQLEQGSTATSYIAHAEQNITIPLPEGMELCKIGEYSDKIFHNIPSNPMYNSSLVEGGWYKYDAIGKVILNGTETTYAVTLSSNYARFRTDAVGVYTNSDSADKIMVYSNYFKGITFNNRGTEYNGVFNGANGTDTIYINIPIEYNITTLAEFKTWLSTHNLELYYVLATPTYTQITDTDTLEALYKIEHLLMYKEYTHIKCMNEVNPKIKVKYLYDNEINNSFGSIIDALEERVHSLESGVNS